MVKTIPNGTPLRYYTTFLKKIYYITKVVYCKAVFPLAKFVGEIISSFVPLKFPPYLP